MTTLNVSMNVVKSPCTCSYILILIKVSPWYQFSNRKMSRSSNYSVWLLSKTFRTSTSLWKIKFGLAYRELQCSSPEYTNFKQLYIL
jgi:hypothetical protein